MNPILNEKRYIDNTDWKSVDDELPDEFECCHCFDDEINIKHVKFDEPIKHDNNSKWIDKEEAQKLWPKE